MSRYSEQFKRDAVALYENVLIEGHGIAFELFGVPGHGGRLPFFPARLGWISGVHQTGVRPEVPVFAIVPEEGHLYSVEGLEALVVELYFDFVNGFFHS
ncbi:hypothetical protein [Corynebacterium accolens]|uniref:hypothetical protein n=1 Tax=Corynebacterium accolens TaxID=38284 RepID=UPI00266FB59F|nr:hypothetical protein [Corynebacterium accolens]WKS60333.1 hypothetical protein NLL43_11280 [Corynebacterium accolens]